MALADGHGSCSHSDIGAELAVQVAVEALWQFGASMRSAALALDTLQTCAQEQLAPYIVRAWTERTSERAHEVEQPLAAFGSTLLFALATPEYLLLGQLGDGDMLLVDREQGVKRPLGNSRNMVGEETSSLCQDEAWRELSLCVLPAPSSESLLLLSTDGYSKSYETDAIFQKIGPDYLNMIGSVGIAAVNRELPRFLETVTNQGSGDDVTLGLVYWAGRKQRARRT